MTSALQGLSPTQWRDLLDLSRKAKAKDSTRDFIEYVWAEHLRENNNGFLPDHLLEAIDFIEGLIAEGESGEVLLPRGASKTTGITQGWASKKIADNPNIRIGLFSNTDRQAWAFSGAIRSCYETNDRFIELYGDCVSRKKWTDAEWLHKDSIHQRSKDRTVYAGGVGTPIVSKRFDIILLDDILDKENTSSPDQMQKVKDWFNLVLRPCLVPGGIIIYIGTRWADGDLAEELSKPIEEGGRGWKHFIKPAWEEVDGELVSYWPDRWPVPVLQHELEEMGSAFFGVAYLNDTSGLTKGNVFPRMPMPDAYYFTTLPDGDYIFKMGIDLASSERESADFTARAVTAIDQDGDFWVLHVYRDRREDKHAEFIVDGFMAYSQVALVIVENNQFQSTLVKNVMRDYPAIPIEGRKTDTDKVTRARAVAARYESHKVHHHISLKGSEFELELRRFRGDGKSHDDQVDALGFSMDLTMGGFFFGKLGGRGSAMLRR